MFAKVFHFLHGVFVNVFGNQIASISFFLRKGNLEIKLINSQGQNHVNDLFWIICFELRKIILNLFNLANLRVKEILIFLKREFFIKEMVMTHKFLVSLANVIDLVSNLGNVIRHIIQPFSIDIPGSRNFLSLFEILKTIKFMLMGVASQI